MPLTCDDQGVRDGRLGQHALYVATEELQGLAAAAVRIHQYHDPAGPPHLGVRGAWRRGRGVGGWTRGGFR